MQPIYTDGIANIAFHDGVVRLELVTTRQVDKDKQAMTPTLLLTDKYISAYIAL